MAKRPLLMRIIRLIYHLPNFLKLAWRLFRDPRVPIYKKTILFLFAVLSGAVALVYYVMPIDFWPDFLPLGRIEDPIIPVLLVFLPGVWLFVKSCERTIVMEHVDRIDQENRGGRFFRFII